MKSATAILAIAVLVGMAGCAIVRERTVPADREARRARLVEASNRAAAYADSVTGIARPDKVAALVDAGEITVGDVADFVYAYGWTLVPAPLPDGHWAPSKAGSYPVSHYVFELRGSVADTALAFYAPDTFGALTLRVRAVDEAGNVGLWSDVGVSKGRVMEGLK